MMATPICETKIKELESIVLSLENSGTDDLDGKTFTDIEIDRELEDLEVMLASFGKIESSIVDKSTSLTPKSLAESSVPSADRVSQSKDHSE